MRIEWLIVMVLASVAAYDVKPKQSETRFPQIAIYGGIVDTPAAAEPPRRGAKIIFDITTDAAADEVNPGLVSVARYLNLNAAAELKPTDVNLALVLHGPATRAALGDAGYAKRAKAAKNPSLELIHKLKECGVEVFVCGQSLARNKFDQTDVAGDVKIAVSAMTVNANRQQDGYSYLSIH